MPTYTLTCMHLVPSSGLQNRTRVLFALWRAEGTQPHPCLRKARSWWFMGKGHSVQSSEQGTNFNQELQNDLGTEGKAPKETPPDGTLALLEDIRMRLGSSLALLPPLPPGQCCQLMGSSPSSPHQSLVICLQALWGWLPSAPVRLCAAGTWWLRGQAGDWKWRPMGRVSRPGSHTDSEVTPGQRLSGLGSRVGGSTSELTSYCTHDLYPKLYIHDLRASPASL